MHQGILKTRADNPDRPESGTMNSKACFKAIGRDCAFIVDILRIEQPP